MSPPDRLPRRDFLLIPALALLTLLVLAGAGEVASRQMFAEAGSETCGVVNAAGIEVRRPNCSSTRKFAESPVFTNAYNDCGYRTPEPCGTRPAGAVRVALMGASTAQGMKVRYEDTFAARLSQALGRACGRPVEFQNMGVPAAGMLDIYRRMDEALAMRPDLVVLAITPVELRGTISDRQLAARDQPPAPSGPGAPGAPPVKSLVSRLSDLANDSRILLAAQHFLLQDDATFAKLYMLHGEEADYLRLPYGAGWEQRLRAFDVLLDGMADRARAAGVPLMVTLGPARVQATLLDKARLPPGVDPFEIGRRVAGIAARHGVLFQDLLPGFAAVDRPGAMFYPVDGHMDAAGHAAFANAMRAGLSAVPAFAGCARP